MRFFRKMLGINLYFYKKKQKRCQRIKQRLQNGTPVSYHVYPYGFIQCAAFFAGSDFRFWNRHLSCKMMRFHTAKTPFILKVQNLF